MDMYKLKFTKLQLEIFRLLCIKSGSALNKRQMAHLLNVSPTAVAKSLPRLQKAQFITYKKPKNLNLSQVRLNRDSRLAMQLKRAENLRMIYESGIADFLENKLPGATIILFGSYSRGDDIITSDIDIAIVGRPAEEVDLHEYEKKLEKRVTLNFYDSFKNIHKDLKESLCNGIVLVGGIGL